MSLKAHKLDDTRKAGIIALASEAFLSGGYEGTSMSAIATLVGGSKTTLWTYFPCKRDLFMAVADDMIGRYVDAISDALEPSGDLEVTLNTFGRRLLHALTLAPVAALIRIVTGEAGRFPELGALFHQRGLGHGWAILKDFLDDAVGRQQLQPSIDTLRASQHLIAMFQSGCYQRFMMGGTAAPDGALIAQDVAAAVRIFLQAYGVQASGTFPAQNR
jgi:TetR/AcrR family transcriptional repressor of mexJK operon